ncbi:DUF3472 domain-containing protein [Mucilaginibacter phyllosphaerae]|uniref:DUF3472 domain-containing protein n=1 Tax=Mucilaginibacter phyllosphaerae TaxID=1812349 RepID=A0A4Y8ADE8_9SPHI|nr:DUF3472 domain-containing protein [Mucilaginibacter phyllosphaerae]MBB3970212.1 hypothetical protein [Mucilaginibacter phyllosphaerae]TEW66593.1 DUF3472 domain-containing protein [Mucilaginibacter phyllosphaerae]GGH10560.1 hypothetical protein GCM10007352_16390 [Mucilaginibacter phyllosphaerae]
MKIVFIVAAIVLLNNLAFGQSAKMAIPLGGNAWAKGNAVITDGGAFNWKNRQDVINIYFKTNSAHPLKLALRLRVPAGKSTIAATVANIVFVKKLNNAVFDTVSLGTLNIRRPGYVKVALKGISKTDSVYAQVTDLIVDDLKPQDTLTYVVAGSSFHFGRRGPSVHLTYQVPNAVKNEVKWFYNEITVPQKMDVIGSYFMADGFKEGYFGMQVNSAAERRVLFSVWSPFNTDDPNSIPDSLRIKLLKKGDKVHGGVFGDEGSGGQSYLHYPWQAGNTYAFLLEANPNKIKNTTTYTAWFKDIKAGKWLLIASFSRPKTTTYLKGLHSFLENFEPENGDKTRLAYYTNQWVADSSGQWQPICSATFTGDEAARKNYRNDYAGGTNGKIFYLKNGGFFNGLTQLNQKLAIKPRTIPPVIAFKDLPR